MTMSNGQTMITRGFAVAFAAAVASSAAGCQDGAEPADQPQALSKAAYIERANASCVERERASGAGFERIVGSDTPTPSESQRFLAQAVLPALKAGVKERAQLPAPEGDAEEIEAINEAAKQMVSGFERIASSKAQAHALMLGQIPDPATEADTLNRRYGIDECGGAESESTDFAAADLERLNFASNEVPGMEYQPELSGLGAFSVDQEEDAEEGDRSGLEFLDSLEAVGLEANYVSQFFATSRKSELGFVESIAFLFKDEAGAAEAIEIVAEGAARNISPADEIDPPPVGDQAFGLRGKFDGFLTYSFGWRVGDVVQLFTVAPRDQDAGPEVAVELGQQLAAKAQQ
jgi:hypothetical protein